MLILVNWISFSGFLRLRSSPRLKIYFGNRYPLQRFDDDIRAELVQNIVALRSYFELAYCCCCLQCFQRSLRKKVKVNTLSLNASVYWTKKKQKTKNDCQTLSSQLCQCYPEPKPVLRKHSHHKIGFPQTDVQTSSTHRIEPKTNQSQQHSGFILLNIQ